MEVVSWARLTAELGVRYTPVVAWTDQPALEAAARSAVREQASHDAEEAEDHDDDAARPAVLWRRDGVNVAELLGVSNLSSLEEQARALKGGTAESQSPPRACALRSELALPSPEPHALTHPAERMR
jgi:hypothetical protein